MTTPSEADLHHARRTLRAGGVVLHPTETVYGFGCDGRSEAACRCVRELKGIPPDRALIWLVRDLDQANEIAKLSPAAGRLAEAFWPGALTLVVEGGAGTQALRISPHPVVADLLSSLGGPLASTSANRTGEPAPTAVSRATWVGDHGPDAVLDSGPCAGALGSTIVDCTGIRPRLLRAGDLDVARLLEVEEIDNDDV